jgi:hypothetical protein
MSTFWMAVFYERAFEVFPYPGTHGLEVAYDWNSFNATAHQDYEGWTGALNQASATRWQDAR